MTEGSYSETANDYSQWKQGDFWLGASIPFSFTVNMASPLSELARAVVNQSTEDEFVEAPYQVIDDEGIEGFSVLSQTCDIVRSAERRPYLEIAPLVRLSDDEFQEVRSLKRPAFAFLPGAENKKLVVDLDRVMTLDKGGLEGIKRETGCLTDQQRRDFASSLARKRARFAFPDDFGLAAKKFVKRVKDKSKKASDEGEFIRGLSQIRALTNAEWDADEVEVTIYLILEDALPINDLHSEIIKKWVETFSGSQKYEVTMIACHMRDITANDYISSDILNFDDLSVS